MRQSLLLFALLVSLVSIPHAQSTSSRAQAPKDTKSSAAAKPGAMVNLNTATVAELQTLPGIGARVAARIVEYRESKGPFKKIEELMNVQGIGEKSFLKLKPQLSVGAARPESSQQ
jgi:competence protein ComEA